MPDRSRMIYTVLRIISCGIWAALWMASPYMRSYDLSRPLQFCVVALFCFLLGYIHTIPHPKTSWSATIYVSLFWSLFQVVIAMVVYVVVHGLANGGHLRMDVRLTAIAESLRWVLLGLFFNPVFLGIVWTLAFLNHLLLCAALARVNFQKE